MIPKETSVLGPSRFACALSISFIFLIYATHFRVSHHMLARSRARAVARSFPAAHSRQWRRQTIATIATVIGTCKKEEDPAQHLATPTSLHPLTNMYARQVLCYRRDNLTYSSAATAQVRTRPWQATQWSRAGTIHQSVRSFDHRALLNFCSC